jgi:hypothetical protein
VPIAKLAEAHWTPCMAELCACVGHQRRYHPHAPYHTGSMSVPECKSPMCISCSDDLMSHKHTFALLLLLLLGVQAGP